MPAGEPGQGAIVYRRAGGIDAIDQYSERLLEAFQAVGYRVVYLSGGLGQLRHSRSRPAWILLQYNPFCYGRWGFAPRMVLDARRLRRAQVPFALMVHEAWVDMSDWRTAVMGLWQRLQLRALARRADVVLTSTQAIAAELGPRAVHLPVGANIVPVEVDAQAARLQLGLERPLVISVFGRNHPSRALEYAAAAISAIAEAHGAEQLTVLNLGADAPAIRVPRGVELRAPGPLTGSDLSPLLAATDLMLLPLADGLSTRRSTLMSALAHGLPVLGLRGEKTDQVLIEAVDALVLTPMGDLAGFALTALALSRQPDRRREIGAAGRRLYEQHFAWPVTAARVAAELEGLGVRVSVLT